MTATTPIKNIDDVERVEAVLRGELNARAVGLSGGRPPITRVVAAVRSDRMRRRTYAGTGFVLVAALVAAVTPAVVGAARGAGVASAAVAGSGPSQLVSMAPRGNLVGDTALVRAVETRLPGDKVLYANDDGTHTVVIGADAAKSSAVEFRTLIGQHGATASQLEAANGDGSFSEEARTYTFVSRFTSADDRVPLVVLGPADLTGIEYATGIGLTEKQGKLVPARTGVKQVTAVDGVAEAELTDSDPFDSSSDPGLYFAVRAKLGEEYVNTSPVVHVLLTTTAGNIEDPEYDPIRSAVVAKGKAAGITLPIKGSHGDALADNVALVLSDAANLADVSPSNVATRIDWVGRETPEWIAALVEFAAPGLLAFQAFIRGFAPGVSDGDSSALARSFVRPVEALRWGQIPTTVAAFGGTPEFTTIGGGLFEHW